MQKNIILLATLLAGLSAGAAVDKYKIDPAHTAIVFKVNHMGFSNTYGQFPGVEGSFLIDEAKPEASNIDLKIKTDSLTTQEGKRDKHLKSPDFFNAKANPTITFKSKAVKKASEGLYKIDGELTMNGVTKPLSFDFKRSRTGKGMQGETRTGGDATFKIKRSDFNMKYMNGENQIGDEVELMISLEGVRE